MFKKKEYLAEKIEFRLTKSEKENLKEFLNTTNRRLEKKITMTNLIKQALNQYTHENNLTNGDFAHLKQIIKLYLEDFPESKDKNLLEYKKEIEVIQEKIQKCLNH